MYRNLVTYNKANVQYVWESTWDQNGKRIEIETPVEPYLFYQDRSADDTYKSIYGKNLRKMIFQTDFERREWIKRSPNIPLFEHMPVIRQYLIDKYFGQEHTMEFSQYPFRIFYMDIEVEINNEFPDQYKADYPINVISIYNTLQNEVIAWCYKSNADQLLTEQTKNKIFQNIKKDYDSSPKYEIRSFNNEIRMLHDFMKYWTDFYPDIVSGWNCIDINSPIWLADRISKLKNIKINTELYNQNYVKKIFPIQKKQNYIIHLINGFNINSSKDHKFNVFILPHGKYTNFCAKHDIFDFKTVDEIEKSISTNNVYVKIPKHKNLNKNITFRDLLQQKDIVLNKKLLSVTDIQDLNNKNNIVLKSRSKNIINLNDQIDEDIFYTLGLLYTDGTKDLKRNVFTFYNKNINVLQRVSNVLDHYKFKNHRQKKNNINETIVKRNNKIYTYNWIKTSSNTVLGLLADNFIFQNNKKKMNLELLSRISEKQFFAFLSGLIDGDGCITKEGNIQWCNYNDDCITLHQLLLWNNIYSCFGKNILYFNKTSHNINSLKEKLSLCIDYKKNNLFNIVPYKFKPNKSNKIKFMDCGDFYAVKIAEIDKTNNFIEMRDIETNNHTFNVNGVLVHNCNAFDIPYIINRLNSQLSQNETKKLSPVSVRNPIYETYDKKTAIKTYKIQGISICDYLPLYKKFAGNSKQSFKLDAIAKQELDVGKFDYYDIGYESMQQFMQQDFSTFVQYNIIDTTLVRMLDKKLGFITLMRNICNISLCEYEVIFKSIPYILGALTIQARINNVKFLTNANKDQSSQQQQEDDDYGYTRSLRIPY